MANENLKDWEAVYKAARIKKNTAIMSKNKKLYDETAEVLEKIEKIQQNNVYPVPLQYRYLIEEGSGILHSAIQKSNEEVKEWQKEEDKNHEINRRIAERKRAAQESELQKKYCPGQEVFVTLKWVDVDCKPFIDDLPVQIMVGGMTDDSLNEQYENILEGDKVKVKLIRVGFEQGVFDRKLYAFKAYVTEIITQSSPC